jgi:hypothetical protein
VFEGNTYINTETLHQGIHTNTETLHRGIHKIHGGKIFGGKIHRGNKPTDGDEKLTSRVESDSDNEK